MSFLISEVLGRNGVIIIIGLTIFVATLKYSSKIFDWIESNTLGNKDYVMDKLKFLFIEIEPEKITYLLLFSSFGLSALILSLFGILGMWIFGTILAITFLFIGFRIPRWIIDYLVQKRIKNFSEQMVDALTLLGSTIRAGLSVPQSLGVVVDEMSPPISQEFNLILQQNRIGVPIEECFEGLSKRVPTEDNDMFVTSINILRETGGNLAEVFDTIVSVIRERIRLQQKIDTEKARNFMQGKILFATPFLMGGLQGLSDPESLKAVFTQPIGILIILLALALNIIGGMIIMKIVKVSI